MITINLRSLRRKLWLLRWLSLPIVAGLLIAAFSLTTQPSRPALAECAIIPDAVRYQQQTGDGTAPLTMSLRQPDGTPIANACMTFLRDLGPGAKPELLGSCTTNNAGQCTVNIPGGIIIVVFGPASAGGESVDNSSTLNGSALGDAGIPSGLVLYFPGDTASSAGAVLVQKGGTIIAVHDMNDGSGTPAPYAPPAPGGSGNAFSQSGLVTPAIPPQTLITPASTGLPTGNVVVKMEGIQLQMGADKAYCYYAINNQVFARAPVGDQNFLPGGGSAFDLGGALGGSNAPAVSLNADSQTFDLTMNCWGWSGDSLTSRGIGTASIGRDQWDGRTLSLSGGGFSVTFRLTTNFPTTPAAVVVLPGSTAAVQPPIMMAGTQATGVAAPANNLPPPYNVRLDGDSVAWDYDPKVTVGGFRIYRDGEVIATVSSTTHSYTGDPIKLGYCGDKIIFAVTAFQGPLESPPGGPASRQAIACAARIRVRFDSLDVGTLVNCDGGRCAPTTNVYGYFIVNGKRVDFGGGTDLLAMRTDTSYQWPDLLKPLKVENSVVVNLSVADALTIEVILFNHHTQSPDSLLCTWRDELPATDTQGWNAQNGRVLAAQGTKGAADCKFTATILVESLTPTPTVTPTVTPTATVTP